MMTMARTVTVSLGPHYEEFIQKAIAGGRFNNVSEVIRAALRQMEDEEARLSAIRSALVEGENSGIVEDFDPQTYVQKLNEEYDAQIQSF